MAVDTEGSGIDVQATDVVKAMRMNRTVVASFFRVDLIY